MHSLAVPGRGQATSEPTPAQPQSRLTARDRPDVRGPPGPHDTALQQRTLSKAQLPRGLRKRPKTLGVQESQNRVEEEEESTR